MEKLNVREFTILRYLAEDIQYIEEGPDVYVKIPSGFTKPQFTTACDSLEAKGMIIPAYCEDHVLQDARVSDKGICYLDDLKDARNHQLRKVLKENNLTTDQYDLLKQAEQGNVDYNASNISPREFKNYVFNPLCQRNLVYAAPGSKMTEVVITRLGKQLLEEIEYEVNTRMLQDNSKPPFMRNNEESTAIMRPTVAEEENFKMNDENNTVNELRKQKAQLEIENSELKGKVKELEDARRSPIEEQTIIQYGQGKNIKNYHISARQCADIVKKYRLLEQFQANTIEEMLSEITGMDATSFHKFMR